MKLIILRLFLTIFVVTVFAACLGSGDGDKTTTLSPETTTTSLKSALTTIISPIQTTTSTTIAPKKETSELTIKITDTGGNPLNGIVAFEKGFVHKGRYLLGTNFSNGMAEIVLPKIRDIPEAEWNYWGMHVYATDHIYFPQEIEVLPGEDYIFEVSLAPEPNPSDDPIMSSIKFEKGNGFTTISVDLSSPINRLGPQNFALNTKTNEILTLQPPIPVTSLRDNYPNGVYTSSYPDDATNPEDWYFVAADHSCSNGPLQGYPVNENIIPALADAETPLSTGPVGGTAVELGEQLVSSMGCTGCHHFDKESKFEEKDDKTNWLIGPGLKGVFKNENLPATGRPSNEENVEKQIREGGGGMPSYSSITQEEFSNIITYLKSL
jgi:hypothetical protein